MKTRSERNQLILRRRRSAQRARGRRGVLLLIVLSILVMFMLVGTAFVLTGSRSGQNARVDAKSNVASPQQADLLDRALRQVLRDTNDRNSALRYHSLLRDAYGTDGFVANVFAGDPNDPSRLESGFQGPGTLASKFSDDVAGDGGPARGQLIDIYVRDDLGLDAATMATVEQTQSLTPDYVVELEPSPDGLPVNHTLSRVNGYYNGCLLTLLSGPAKGQSTRILDYQYDPASNLSALRVMAFPRANGAPLQLSVTPGAGGNDLVKFENRAYFGHTFMVNGRPFNGSGVGLNLLSDPKLARLTAMETLRLSTGAYVGMETALAPHSRYFFPSLASSFSLQQGRRSGVASAPLTNEDPFYGHSQNAFTALNTHYQHFVGPGGADESYDAPDFQNMFLASNPLRPRSRGRVVNQGSQETQEVEQYYAIRRNKVVPPARLDLEGLPIPSFHRPALVNYWLHKLMNAPWLISAVADADDRVKAILQPYGPDSVPEAVNGVANDRVAPNIAAQIVAFKRKYILRPLPEDHPNFTGGNPFASYTGNLDLNSINQLVFGETITFPSFEVAGPWDVDNDGDGVPDSIWVDLGMPVQRTEDGRHYKPLFAILVQDLDGRLNLNAHGSPDHMASQRDMAGGQAAQAKLHDVSTGGFSGVNLAGGVPGSLAGNVTVLSSDDLPHGSGWGPAEISLRAVLSTSLPQIAAARSGNPTVDDYARLLLGRPALNAGQHAASTRVGEVWGRYGAVVNPALATAPGVPFFVDPANFGGAVNLNTLDRLSTLEKHDYPNFAPAVGAQLASTAFSNLSAGQTPGYGSMPDLKSVFAVGLDYAGQPIQEPQHEAAADYRMLYNPTLLLVDNPYELDLMDHSRRDSVSAMEDVTAAYGSAGSINDDAPFSPGELERILRSFDADAARLPDRLWNLVDAFDPQKLAIQNAQYLNGPGTPTLNTTTSPGQLLQAQIEASTNARSVTTESFDIPSTNEDWTARLVVGADGLPGAPGVDDNNDGLVDGPGEAGMGVFDPTDNQPDSDDYTVVMGELPPANARLLDYLRYRIVLQLKRQGVVSVGTPASDPTVVEAVNRIIDGGARSTAEIQQMRTGGAQPYERRASFGGLLAPEVIAGLKMDLNRPFGDGRDNPLTRGGPNGVVDEPLEAGEPWVADGAGNRIAYLEQNGLAGFQGSVDRLPNQAFTDTYQFDYTFGKDANGRGAYIDTNNNNLYDAGTDERIIDDAQLARQLYARHLYCMALLLMDEQYLMPFDKRDAQVLEYLDPDAGRNPGSQREPSMAWKIAQSLAGDDDLDGTPVATAAQKQEGRRRAWRKLTCRRIAQWAINCVDMRDPDAICTPFEYDENPWDGWNVVAGLPSAPQIHPIDGDPSTNENLGQYREISASGWSNQVGQEAMAHNATRGLVWGMERPELLLTETFATHDRRTEDLEGFGDENPNAQSGDENELMAPSDPNATADDDMDQRLRPLGTLFVEVYNPNSPDAPSPAELSRTVTMNYPSGQTGIALDRMSEVADSDGKFSPVWRLIVVEEDPRLRNDRATFDNQEYSNYEGFNGVPSLTGLANAVSQGQVRPLASDPDFPSFDPLKVPEYRADVNGQLTVAKRKHGAYIERAIYLNTGSDEVWDRDGRDPEALPVRIPVRYTEYPIPPARTQPGVPNLRHNIHESLLWPEGNKIVDGKLRVYDYHFPPADLNGNGDHSDFEPFAPILPGRYAVIGTAGYTYDARWNTNAKSAEYAGRFITPFGRSFASSQQVQGGFENQPPGRLRDDTHHRDTLRMTRRFDMMPHPNPEIHQFAVMHNGGPESRLIDALGNGVFDRNVTNPPIANASDPSVLAETVGDLGFDPTPIDRETLRPENQKRQIQPVVSIPIEGLSVSTPLDGYLTRMLAIDREAPSRWAPNAAYGEGAFFLTAVRGPLDTPLDVEEHLTKNVTTPNFRSVHLQRLADPTLPWNPVDTTHAQHVTELPVNPYVTVDTESVDLTAFNGVDPNDPAPLNQNAPGAQPEGLVHMTMASLQRGTYEAAVGDPTTVPDPADPASVAAAPAQSTWSREPTRISKDISNGAGISSSALGPGQFAYQWYDPSGGQTPMKSQAFANFMNLDSTLEPERPMVLNVPIRHTLGYANGFFPAINGGRNIAEPYTSFYTSNAFIDANGDGSPDPDTTTNYHDIDINGDGVAGDLVGAPKTNRSNRNSPQDDNTYPWVTWNNRPYASALELLQVPATTAAGLGAEFSVYNGGRSVVPNDYNGALGDLSDEAANNDARNLFQRGTFGHLLNLFSTSSNPAQALNTNSGSGNVEVLPSGAANLHRLTSYVRVPSRFVATQTRLNPDTFNVFAAGYSPSDPRAGLLAPFNRVDQYREPGRVNLNTATGLRPDPTAPLSTWSPTYDGLMHRYRDGNLVDTGGVLQQLGHRGPAWRDVVLSRRGYVDPASAGGSERLDTSEMSLNPLVPTFFGNPFREPDEGQLVPLESLVHAGAEASLLRSHPFSPATGAGGGDAQWGQPNVDDNSDGVIDDTGEAGLGGDTPLFEATDPNRLGLALGYEDDKASYDANQRPRVPLFSAGTTETGLNSERNAALRYMPLTRMSSMTTTRSGVFAIWVTVGFFEVTPADPWVRPDGSAGPVQQRFNSNRELYDRVYPDGYQLGKELGSDTGDTNRHRGFWIVDRTLPVAFKPGEDVNLEKMILLRREIE